MPFQKKSRRPLQLPYKRPSILFIHHIAGGARDRTHASEVSNICKKDIAWMTNLDYVYEAIAIAERERWPMLGLSTTRRSLNLLALRYNDASIACLACFICAQLRTTCEGYASVDLQSSSSWHASPHVDITYLKEAAFQEVERDFPGTLLNNCGSDLWKKRYVDRDMRSSPGYPWKGNQLIDTPFSTC